MSNPYAPDETPSQIFAEETWLQGALISNIGYGIETTLFFICFALLVKQMDSSNRRRHIFLLTFITVVFIIGSLWITSVERFTQLAFIENRNFPGGPSAFEEAAVTQPVHLMGNAVIVLGNWLMDGLFLWRCIIIYSTSKVLRYSLLWLPCCLFAASIALGALFGFHNSVSSPLSNVHFALAYFSATLALNVVLTILIVARLLAYRQHLRGVLGANHTVHYMNIISIMLESAAFFTLFMIAFLVTFALEYPLAFVLLQSVGPIQTVTSLLLVFRVATGRGWEPSKTTEARTSAYSGTSPVHFSTIQFLSNGTSTSPGTGMGTEAKVGTDEHTWTDPTQSQGYGVPA